MQPARVITRYSPAERVWLFVSGCVKLMSLALIALPLLFLFVIWVVMTLWAVGPVFGFGGPALMMRKSSPSTGTAAPGFTEHDGPE